MTVSQDLSQSPAPGKKLLAFRGDAVVFCLHSPGQGPGTAWLRTNLGRAALARQEVICQVEQNEPILYHDWSDIPMVQAGDGCFQLCLGLTEVGHFEAKAFFLPEGKDSPVWPPGPNTVINVEPAETVCGNIIYNAFVRQFGPNKHQRRLPSADADFRAL
ncbi:MAG: glycogen debranching protein, partial [Desulfosalsimonas sp.]